MNWLTTSEAARYLKIKPRTLQVWAREGTVTGHQLGKKRKVWYFLQEELDRDLLGVVPSSRLTTASETRPN